jgi:ferric-dicitrate binding protein FerR (iron transport regulator)
MVHFNQNIYEDLLADNRFVLWALGKNETDNAYWEKWKEDHTDSLHQFTEACRTVQMLKFKSPEISSKEVSERWLQSKKEMKLQLHPHLTSDSVYWYRRIAGILIIPLLILSVWFFYNQHQLQSNFNQINGYSQKKSIHVVAPLGVQLHVELPDGSKAWLNSGSEINYPAYFSLEKREVEMTGEVYFQVSKSSKMFVVKNPGPTIKVYGTEFNVHAYSNEKEITIALAKGKIALEKNNRELMMSPGEVAIFDKTSEHLIKQKSDIYPYTSWREGKYIFRDAPLEVILKTLERRYKVTIHVDDPDLTQFKYDATINGEPLEQILELLTFSAPLKYEYKRQQLKADGSYSQAEVKLWKDTSKIINQKN